MTMPTISPKLLDLRPLVVAALHLPDLAVARHITMAWLEEYVLANAEVFAGAGIPAIMLQDMTRVPGPAAPDSIAIMGALGRLLRERFPAIALGIIFRAHDAAAPLAVAHAVGASFVRIKVYVGGVMSAAGPRDGLGTAARAYRHDLRRDDIAILADVHDRTSALRSAEADSEAAGWAVQLSADALVVTGASFAESLARIEATRAAGIRAPVLLGGGATTENLEQALRAAAGVIVSASLMRAPGSPGDTLRWDARKTQDFMDRAQALTRP